jgi:hypothetical protein
MYHPVSQFRCRESFTEAHGNICGIYFYFWLSLFSNSHANKLLHARYSQTLSTVCKRWLKRLYNPFIANGDNKVVKAITIIIPA